MAAVPCSFPCPPPALVIVENIDGLPETLLPPPAPIVTGTDIDPNPESDNFVPPGKDVLYPPAPPPPPVFLPPPPPPATTK
jgi:hypothetical protein